MRRNSVVSRMSFFITFFIIMTLGSNAVFAHCDTMNGPVVKAAIQALNTGDVNLILIWIKAEDELEIKKAFEKALAVRKLSIQAKEMADNYFFETLVRLHRAGEGASYTGLNPAGMDFGPAIPAVDRAVEEGSAEKLLKLINSAVIEGINENFKRLMETKNFKKEDVKGGREYVASYVAFMHYVERIYENAGRYEKK